MSAANFRDQHQQMPYLSAPGSFAMWPMHTGTMMVNIDAMGYNPQGQLGARLIAERQSGFPAEVQEKAWAMVKEFMTADQWHAFHEEAQTVELTNKEGAHRLLIHRSGDFRMLKGGVGEGIEVVAGKIYESKYPLGDEMAALIALFRYDTQGMVAAWRCGNFTSRNEGQGVIGENTHPRPVAAECQECKYIFGVQTNSNGVPPETVECPRCHEILEAENAAQTPRELDEIHDVLEREVKRQRRAGRLAEPNPLDRALGRLASSYAAVTRLISGREERRR